MKDISIITSTDVAELEGTISIIMAFHPDNFAMYLSKKKKARKYIILSVIKTLIYNIICNKGPYSISAPYLFVYNHNVGKIYKKSKQRARADRARI